MITLKVIAYLLAIISLIYLFKRYILKSFEMSKKPYYSSLKEFENLFEEKADVIKPLFNNIFIAACLIVFVLSVDVYLINNRIDSIDKYGAFGDFMGGILNPIFMFLTLYALIVTIVIQRKELKLTRKEFRKTATSLSKQATENTFFNTIDLHHKIVDNIKFDFSELEKTINPPKNQYTFSTFKTKNIVTGIDSFDVLVDQIFEKAKTPSETNRYYSLIYTKHSNIFGCYLRNLFEALNLIDLENGNKKPELNTYSRLLKAQLSSNELTLLFLACLNTRPENIVFKNLIIKYGILEHLIINKKGENFLLSGKVLVSEEMVVEYYTRNEIPLDLKKYAKGAYGNNINLPYDLVKQLRRKNKS